VMAMQRRRSTPTELAARKQDIRNPAACPFPRLANQVDPQTPGNHRTVFNRGRLRRYHRRCSRRLMATNSTRRARFQGFRQTKAAVIHICYLNTAGDAWISTLPQATLMLHALKKTISV
jgi:hypothetical protein